MRLTIDARAQSLARLYATAEAQLQTMVERAINSGALGTLRIRQQRLAEVQARLAALQDEAIPEATQLVTDAYRLGANIAGVSGAFSTGFHVESLNLLADNLTNSLNDAAERVGRRVDGLFRRAGLQAAAQHLIQASTRREASRQLREDLAAQGVRAFVDKRGREWGLATYTEMVVRTTTREAVSHGTVNRMTEAGVDLVTITSHKHESDICDEYDGKTYSLHGTTEGYKILDRLPPFHPNCRHVLRPATANLDALEASLTSRREAVPA